ncbi:PAS domain S-box protein [Halorubellus sp. PRR65]|uniref:PAS domain S-box protein n=1 Tax=Halorubellus sp. PRR65 TaxID=3098148 RepID=UPI002B25F28E|nr:PAS domain S-box protein [Halorubellus sp. PRR65]
MTDRDAAVLVVDDDESIRTLCERLFTEFSALSVYTAPDVAAARAILDEDDDVKCVVSDYVLPDESGVEFARSITSDDLPFVLLTGKGNDDVVDAAFDAGADDYFRKEAGASNYRVLVRRVENLVEQRDAQRALERERERFQTLIEASTDLITILDENGQYQYVSPAAEQVFGYEPDELLGENAFGHAHPDDREWLFNRFNELVDAEADTVESLEYRLMTGDGEYRWFESTGETLERSAVGGYVINTRDITERKRRENALEALNDAMRDLITADTNRDIAETLVETPARVSAATNAAYYAWCEDVGALQLRQHTWESNALPDRITGDSAVCDGFVDGATERVSNDPEHATALPVDAGNALVVPVDRDGVLLCASAEAFDRDDVHITEMLVAGCRAALERTEYVAALERKESELSEKEERLERAMRINDVVRSIDQVVVRSTDKREVARSVCRELADTDFVEMAWFGVETDGGVDALDWAGGDGEFLHRVLAHAADDDRAPSRLALDTQESVHVASILDDERCKGVKRAALNRGCRSLLSVPIVHRGMVHGVLELYAKRSFSEDDVAMFDELGDTTGYACSAIDQREAHVTDALVEVEVSVGGVDDPLYRAASCVNPSVVVTDVVSKTDQYLVYIEATAVDALADRLVDERAVDRVSELADDRLEVAVSEFPLMDPLAEHAGEFRQFELAADGDALVAQFPARVDLRSFVDDLAAIADSAELTRKEAVTDGDRAFEALDLERELTDRQLEVLKVAYNRGFFAWPRGSTGKEVARSLDISAPTFHQHIRKATDRIFELALDATTANRRSEN